MSEPWMMHCCHGPVVKEEDTGDTWYQWSKCTVCEVVWLSSVVNVNAVRQLKLTKEKE
jgi:hypothetical protein